MNHSDLKIVQRCDLNLLLSLTILIEEQSVSKSAERLNISQPAMSQNLKKLRNLFDIPLFVKQGQGIKATDKALALLPELRDLLRMTSRLILQQPFDPAEVYGVIRVAFMDDITQQIIPVMLEKLLKEAPNVELEFIHRPKNIFSMLESGEIDLASAPSQIPPANIYGRLISNDQYYAAYSTSHPLAQIASPTLKQIFAYNTAEHSSALVVETEIHQLAQQHQLSRKVNFLSSSMVVLLQALVAGHHVGFIPQRALSFPAWKDKLIGTKLTQLPPFESTLYWHARVHRDPLIQWFKEYCLSQAKRYRL